MLERSSQRDKRREDQEPRSKSREARIEDHGAGIKKYSYFPGCSLHGTAKEYDESTRYVCSALGMELEELKDWNCCGATSGHVMRPKIALGLSNRNLELARRAGRSLLVPCIQCFHRLKEAQEEGTTLHHNPEDIKLEYLANTLTQNESLAVIGSKVVRPLSGFRVACYYGCLAARPPKIAAQGNYENPTTLDNLINILGGEAIPWPFKTDCCGGGPMAVIYPEMTRKLSFRLFSWAKRWGANCFMTACPMCQMNLDSRQEETMREHNMTERFPVFFFTELIALAWGSERVTSWLDKHFIRGEPAKSLLSLMPVNG